MKEKIKTLTITFSTARNFGAMLQTYALQQAQMRIGLDNYVYKLPLSANYKPPKFTFSIAYFKYMIIKFLRLINCKNNKIRSKNFDTFFDEYIKSYSETIVNVKKQKDRFDAYITGSDQVFAFTNPELDLMYLNFGDKNTNKYSYAASMGTGEFSEYELEYMKSCFKDYKVLSLREESMLDKVYNLSTCQVRSDVDPTFLLNKKEWQDISVLPNIQSEYILCYPLLSHPCLQNEVDRLKNKYNIPVVVIDSSPIRKIKGDIYIKNAGPREFLGWFANAKYVVTTSFHGTCFSIIFEKQFNSFIKNYKSERMIDLLKKLGLENKIVREDGAFNTDIINYNDVKSRLDLMVKDSYSYLSNIMEECVNDRSK